MIKYEWIFVICFSSLLIFLRNANFQNLVWEFAYFYCSRICMLIVSFVLIERAKNTYEKKLATLLRTLFITLFCWEVLASISWDLANSKGILLALFVIVIVLFANLGDWMRKNKKDERRNNSN